MSRSASAFKVEPEKANIGDLVQLNRKQTIRYDTIRKNRTLGSFGADEE
jgi:hypothetical protein